MDRIEIRTSEGTICCQPDEIVCQRFGLNLQRRMILLEYAVPQHDLLVHHPIQVDELKGSNQHDMAVAEQLQQAHRPWLAGVCLEQLAGLVGRLRVAAGAAGEGRGPGRKSGWQRIRAVPPVARASKRSKEEEIRKVFADIDADGHNVLSLEDLLGYLGDYLGFGQAEIRAFFKQHASADEPGGMVFNQFREGYPSLNPFMLAKRQHEVIVRKPGSLGGLVQSYPVQQLNLDELEDCEVYICNPTAQVFIDFCKRCQIMLGPCESSVFVRDCEDCTLWLAAQQLRTNNCQRCVFHLYSKTEPIIEASQDLAFAPWSARYPKCSAHFESIGFNPQQNLWNAVYDFTGEVGCSHWRILTLGEVVELSVELVEPPDDAAGPDSPLPAVTHAALCADPLSSEGSCGQGVANTPQTRPDKPPAPDAHVTVIQRCVRDGDGGRTGRQ